MRQYLQQKRDVGDALLLFRMGDFYETFYEDARTLSRVLGLTLTARGKDGSDPIPLAGMPYHAVDRYVARLVRAGHKVAISEQVEDPKTAKGVVKREVVRIITPGTLTDAALLDDRCDNYLVAICPVAKTWPRQPIGRGDGGPIGLACVELASGRFFAELIAARDLADEIGRLRPAEILVPASDVGDDESFIASLRESLSIPVTPFERHLFDPHRSQATLLGHFRVATLAGFGFETFDASLRAAGALVEYLTQTQRTALRHILRISPRPRDAHVVIDAVTLRSLEVERTIRDGAREGSLLAAVDATCGAMGARLLREWLCFPPRDVSTIRARQDAVRDLLDAPDRLGRLRATLGDMGDIERIAARVGIGRATPRDLAVLGRTLKRCAELGAIVGPAPKGAAVESNDLLSRLAATDPELGRLADRLCAAIKLDAPLVVREGGFIEPGHNAELDRLRAISEDGARWLAEFQAREASRSGIANLKVGFNSVFGYYIEITHAQRDKAPADYVRRQTVRNAERYITDELKRFEQEALGAADRAVALEIELFERLRADVAGHLAALQATAQSIAGLDVLGGFAELARRRDYCRPELVETAGTLEIADGRHPVLDSLLADRFVPNDCTLSPDGDRFLILTGPNMAGKSTYIRQVALLALLAQAGSYVPARAMRWSPVDRIFARVGASDELSRGHSTFMVEMVETARILNNATADSLVILDEIGRGTSTYDGLAIAWAVTEHLAEGVGCRALFATHYHELTELGGQLRGVANCNVAVREQLRPDGAGRDVVFLHRILPGPADRSYGVHVAAMAGLPATVVRRSERILGELEQRFAKRARGRGLIQSRREPEQPLLFDEAPAVPESWREIVKAVESIEIDTTTPMVALEFVQRLQKLLRNDATGA